MPYVPSSIVVRKVSTHGIVSPDGFRSLVFTDQLLEHYEYRGSRMTNDWTPGEVGAIGFSLQAVAAWLRDIGYGDAPAGVDGLLVRRRERPRVIALDPNVCMTADMEAQAGGG